MTHLLCDLAQFFSFSESLSCLLCKMGADLIGLREDQTRWYIQSFAERRAYAKLSATELIIC